MKILIIGLIATYSTITIASTVKCDISARLENGNYESIDSITLGQSGQTFTSEVGRAIKGQNDLFINAMMGSDGSLVVSLLSGNSSRFVGKTLVEAAGDARALRITSTRDDVSVLCMKK